MVRAIFPGLLGALLLLQPALALSQDAGQDAKAFVKKAVQNEMAKDNADHSHWLYIEVDKKPDHFVRQWVADTANGSLKRVLQWDGQTLSAAEQKRRIDAFLGNPSLQAKQRKSNAHDDKEAAELLRLLPNAFIWTRKGEQGRNTILHFRPDPNFRPPDTESRVFAAMEGDMAVDTRQLRIASLKGRMIRDVKFLGGLLGQINAGGTFDVERRETGDGVWQITETHVHIRGHVLLFKSISEQEDDVKWDFKQLPEDVTMQQAKNELFEAQDGSREQAHK